MRRARFSARTIAASGPRIHLPIQRPAAAAAALSPADAGRRQRWTPRRYRQPKPRPKNHGPRSTAHARLDSSCRLRTRRPASGFLATRWSECRARQYPAYIPPVLDAQTDADGAAALCAMCDVLPGGPAQPRPYRYHLRSPRAPGLRQSGVAPRPSALAVPRTRSPTQRRR